MVPPLQRQKVWREAEVMLVQMTGRVHRGARRGQKDPSPSGAVMIRKTTAENIV